MPGPFRIEGHAIVSEDGMIADSSGLMPNSLKFESDQKVYEAALDGAALIVNGRLSHEGQAQSPARRRLVVTRSVAGLGRQRSAPRSNRSFWTRASVASIWMSAGSDVPWHFSRARPTMQFVSSTSPIAAKRGSALGRRLPSPSPLSPASPVRV